MRFVLPVLLGCMLVPATAFAEDLGLCYRGWDATEAGHHERAIALFRACIKEGHLQRASLAQTYRNIGIASRRNHQPAEAVTAFNQSIALHPADVEEDYVNRGNAYDDLGETALALADYSKALAIKPDLGEAHYNRGIDYERIRAFDKARADFIAAYQDGLRTDLLFERLKIHGLIRTTPHTSPPPKQ